MDGLEKRKWLNLLELIMHSGIVEGVFRASEACYNCSDEQIIGKALVAMNST